MHTLIALLLLTVVPAFAARPIEALVVNEDWQGLAKTDSPSASLNPSVYAHLRAHAFLAMNRNNESTCLFAAMSSPGAVSAWDGWTGQFVTEHADRAVAHYLRGDSLARQLRWQEALDEFGKALALNPAHVLSLNARGVARVINGRHDEALTDFVAAESYGTPLVDVKINRGYLGVLRRYSASASLKSFDAALALNPGASLAVIGRGRALVARGESISGLAELGQSASACSFIDEAVMRDRSVLFAWVRDRDSELMAEARSPDAGTTLTNLLKDVSVKRDAASVKKAVEFAAKTNDVELQKRAANTLQSLERLDKGLAPAIGKAVNELKIENQLRQDDLLKQSTRKVGTQAEVALQVKKGWNPCRSRCSPSG